MIPFHDFFLLYQTGKDLWNSQYTGLYPLPASGFFALWTLLPPLVSLAIVFFGSLMLFVSIFKRKALLWVFFVPVWQVMWLGQVDLIAMWLLVHFSPVSLALLTLKPQLFPLAIPQLLQRKEMWKPFIAWCAVLYIPITSIRPTWIGEWMARINDGRLHEMYGSLWQVPVLAVAILVTLLVTKKITFKVLYWCFNPTLKFYNFSLLAGKTYWLIPASWVILWMTQQSAPNFYWTYALLGIVVFCAEMNHV